MDKQKLLSFKRRALKYYGLYQWLAVAALSVFAAFLLSRLYPCLSRMGSALVNHSGSIVTLAKDPASSLKTTAGRTNLLLLGMGGKGHEGAELTDSMVVVSIHHQSKKATLISVPRDLYSEPYQTKINAVYYYGEQKQPGGGLLLVKAAVEEMTGVPIHYAFTIDFTGFKQAVDLLGGIDVNVEHSFDDYKYPIPGQENAQPESDRYEHLHFDAGWQHLDGDRALKFVRSRYAEGEEGTDYARSRRQQKVMLAIRDKVISSGTFLQPEKISDILNLYGQYIHTDLIFDNYVAFAKLALLVNRDNLNSIPLTTGDPDKNILGVLENPSPSAYQGQWVLIARDRNWEALRQYIANELNNIR